MGQEEKYVCPERQKGKRAKCEPLGRRDIRSLQEGATGFRDRLATGGKEEGGRLWVHTTEDGGGGTGKGWLQEEMALRRHMPGPALEKPRLE